MGAGDPQPKKESKIRGQCPCSVSLSYTMKGYSPEKMFAA